MSLDDGPFPSNESHTKPLTVADLLSTPSFVSRRIEEMTRQRFAVDQLLPAPPPQSRWQKVVGRWRWLRECLAAKIAPWAMRDGWPL